MSKEHPDWAALYQRHRDAMYRVAATVLRERGLTDRAEDAVQSAMASLMKAPPIAADNWEAVLVTVTKRRALDIVKSAEIRRGGFELDRSYDVADPGDSIDDLVETLDRQRLATKLHEQLSLLNMQQRYVAWEYLALGRPRLQVASELTVTPGRISQIAKAALLILRDAMDLRGGGR